MLHKRLHITVLVSATIHLAILFLWWNDLRQIDIASSYTGSPMNITISQADTPKQPMAKPSQENKGTHELPVKPVPVLATTRTNASPQTDPGKLESKAGNFNSHALQKKYALLNNHMIHYLSSEFKLRFKYPILARKRGWQGEVLVDLNINQYGEIAQIVIRRSSGYKVLDHNAVRTFERIGAVSPELKLELAKEHHLSIPVVYKLTGG